MREKANQIAEAVTRMHPLVPTLGYPDAQHEIYKALYELTKQVEIVKKQLLKVEKGDSSSLL